MLSVGLQLCSGGASVAVMRNRAVFVFFLIVGILFNSDF